jgi:NADH:ubiquinone oxidoreductase subunit 3 (subunit A)
MREEEAMIAFFICVSIVTVICVFLSTIRKMYQIQRETALKMKCLECGLNVRDIERVVGVKSQSIDAPTHQGYEASFPMQKPVPPVVAAR